MALGVSGSLDSGVWGSPILRAYSGTRDWGTTAFLFWVMRGLAAAPDVGGAVVPACAAPGSVGGLSLPLAVSTVAAVRVINPVPRGKGKCGLRVSRRFVVPLGLRVVHRGVLTSG